MLNLNSVGSAIDTKTKIVYPKYKNGTIDYDNGVHLVDCSNEWFASLNRLDYKNINELPIK